MYYTKQVIKLANKFEEVATSGEEVIPTPLAELGSAEPSN